MNLTDRKIQTEMHPLFPSGDWEGFYTYHFVYILAEKCTK